LRSPSNGDLYWQRRVGETILHTHCLPMMLGAETFTAAGASWVLQEWLFDLALAASREHQMFAVFAAIVSLLPLGVLLSIVARARREATPQAIGIALVFAGMAVVDAVTAKRDGALARNLSAATWPVESHDPAYVLVRRD
jgi:hypothetical protein